MRKQNGFSMAVIVVLVASVLIVGLIIWRMWDAGQTQQNNINSPELSTDVSQNDKQSTTDPNEGYVVIKEWGVRFKPVDGLTGVQFFKPKDVSTDALSFTTEELTELEPQCGKNAESMVLGLITRSTSPAPEHGGVLATIGGYSYQYRVSGAACSANNANFTYEGQTVTRLSQSLKSLEAAK